MADPFRLRVLKALCETIKTVNPTNSRGDGEPFSFDLRDYENEAGEPAIRVFRGRDTFGINDPLPFVSVLEDPTPLDQNVGSAGNKSSLGDWRLIVQGFIQDDPEHPTDPAHVLAAEVVSVIAAERSRSGDILGLGRKKPCVTDIQIASSPVVRPADDTVSAVAFFYLTVTLSLVEDLTNPFAVHA